MPASSRRRASTRSSPPPTDHQDRHVRRSGEGHDGDADRGDRRHRRQRRSGAHHGARRRQGQRRGEKERVEHLMATLSSDVPGAGVEVSGGSSGHRRCRESACDESVRCRWRNRLPPLTASCGQRSRRADVEAVTATSRSGCGVPTLDGLGAGLGGAPARTTSSCWSNDGRSRSAARRDRAPNWSRLTTAWGSRVDSGRRVGVAVAQLHQATAGAHVPALR